MMKNNLVYFYFIAIITLSGVYMKEILDKKTIENTKGPGFAISGAGGRIAQHLALTEALIKGLYPGNIPIRPSFLSGSSSGAITTVALNAILESEETGNKNFTWELYKTYFFQLITVMFLIIHGKELLRSSLSISMKVIFWIIHLWPNSLKSTLIL